jgi:hypothetical protein
MSDDFAPELGQFAFSNTEWQAIDSPDWINPGLEEIAEAIRIQRGEAPDAWTELTSNSGADPYDSSVFAMRAYCWCDGIEPGHEDGCPPNFEYKPTGLIINWYKHSRRGRSQNQAIARPVWRDILTHCLADINDQPAT